MLAVENLEKIYLLQDSELAELNLRFETCTTVFSIKYLTAETAKYLKQLKQIIIDRWQIGTIITYHTVTRFCRSNSRGWVER